MCIFPEIWIFSEIFFLPNSVNIEACIYIKSDYKKYFKSSNRDITKKGGGTEKSANEWKDWVSGNGNLKPGIDIL